MYYKRRKLLVHELRSGEQRHNGNLGLSGYPSDIQVCCSRTVSDACFGHIGSTHSRRSCKGRLQVASLVRVPHRNGSRHSHRPESRTNSFAKHPSV